MSDNINPVAESTVPDNVKVQAAPANLWEKAVCLSVTLGRFGVKRKTECSLNTDADRRLMSVHKTILECDELKTIEKLDGEIRNELRKHCVPHIFKDGVYLLPIPLIGTVYDYMETKTMERQAAVAKFIQVYPNKAEEHRARLGDQFRRTDYPDVSTMEAMFKFEYKFIEFGVPGTLSEIRKDIYEKERNKAVQSWTETTQVVQAALRESFGELIGHMVEKLDTTEDGKRRVFRNSLVENVNEFFSEFKNKNICDDTELENLIEQAKGVLNGVNANALRSDDTLRETVRTEMAKIKTHLDNNLLVQKGRRYLFDEEESEPSAPAAEVEVEIEAVT